jgi:hypothetical protein
MELILLFAMVFVFGYVAGWLGHARSLLNKLLQDPDEMIRILNEYKKEQSKIQIIEREDATPAREIEVEQQNGVFYLYAKDNGQFLAQAPSLDEALKIVEQRFPNQSFQGIISSEEAKRMGLSN